ncbi:MAG: DotU family type IV/VI secretion system protein [Gemmatimonadaceae bacterium]
MTHAPPAPAQYGAPSAPTGAAIAAPHGRLALALQEILTATVRLRSGRQVAADAEGFRLHAKQVLAGAEQEARAAGHPTDDIRLALFASVVFLDESVLNSGQQMFADWARKPLQDELFGGHLGGEVFFQYLQQQLERDDSTELADLLEVFQLCLLLGFRGRYSMGDGRGELQLLVQRIGEKIARIRGPLGELSPAWRPPSDRVAQVARDPWVRRLAVAAAAVGVLVVALFVVYRLTLGAGARELARLADSAPPAPSATPAEAVPAPPAETPPAETPPAAR